MLRSLLAFVLAATFAGAAPPAQLRAFHTPTGNIGCIADREDGGWSLRCDIGEHDWTGPRRPKRCDLDYGDAIGMSAAGRPFWVCHGDTVLHQGRELAYGSNWQAGPFVCTSRPAGLTCTNSAGHGLFLSRATHRVY